MSKESIVTKIKKEGMVAGKNATITLEVKKVSENTVFRDWETLEVIPEYYKVSITGVIKRPSEWGQIILCHDIDEVSGNLKPVWRVWDKYHNNELHAGTKVQEGALGGEWHDYDEACDRLKGMGLYEDRGYVFGSQWLIKTINEDEIREIVEAFS